MPGRKKPPPPPPLPPPPPPPTEALDGWLQYGGGPHHDFSVDAAVSDLVPIYRCALGGDVSHALLTTDGVAFVRHDQGSYIDRLDPAGVRAWSAKVGADYDVPYWPAMAWGYLWAQTDGYRTFSPVTGQHVKTGAYIDVWGNVTPDPVGGLVYLPNSIHFDGLSCAIVAYRDWGIAWKALVDTNFSHYLRDRSGGGIVADGTRIWYAPRYESQPGAVPTALVSGIYCLSPSTGAILWIVPTLPHGGMALDATGARLYLIERDGALTTNGVPIPGQLVCRDALTGAAVWRQSVSMWSEVDHGAHQAPVMAGDRCLVSTAQGVEAFHLDDGARLWVAPLAGVSQLFPMTEPGGWRPQPVETVTTTCYAEQTDTVIVIGDAGISLLDGATGAVRRVVPVPGAILPLHDPVLTPGHLLVCDAVAAYGFEVR